MKLEDELKEMILEKYGSMVNFSSAIGLSNSTVVTILQRGVMNSNLHNVLKICDGLNISADELAQGRIVFAPSVKEESDSIVVKDYVITVKGRKFTEFEKRMLNYSILLSERMKGEE